MNDAEVVLGYVRKVGAARALSHGPCIRRCCFQPIVHADVPLLCNLNSRLVEADSLCVWSASDRNEKVGSFHRLHATVALDLQTYTLSGKAFDVQNLCAQQYLNSFIPE